MSTMQSSPPVTIYAAGSKTDLRRTLQAASGAGGHYHVQAPEVPPPDPRVVRALLDVAREQWRNGTCDPTSYRGRPRYLRCPDRHFIPWLERLLSEVAS